MSSDPHQSSGRPAGGKAGGPPPALPPKPAVPFTRAAALWSSLIMGFLVLIVLLIFIAQNTQPAEFWFLNLHWTLPLGVAILLAAVAGGLLTVLVGTARIYQLRRATKKALASR